MAETGQFAVLWRGIAEKFKLDIDFVPGDWRRGADLEQIEARLAADTQHRIKAVMIVHNETSTGCVTHPLEVRKAIDRAKHPALFMVDTISGLGSLEYEHDAWGIDVSVAGTQKGLALPRQPTSRHSALGPRRWSGTRSPKYRRRLLSRSCSSAVCRDGATARSQSSMETRRASAAPPVAASTFQASIPSLA
jgi:hypothetical protein